jgi:hypothetical protein
MATPNFNFNRADATDNPNFPIASSDNYNENWDRLDTFLSSFYFSASVGASDTIVLDEVNIDDNPAVKWILFVKNETESKQSFVEVMAINDGSDISFNRMAVHINKVSLGLDVDLSGSNMRLLFTNNESNTVDVHGRSISPFLQTS